MMKDISNADLRLESIPSPNAQWGEIWDFALSFNGFRHWGSFDKCAAIANRGEPSNLTELRTCLFFECQRWRHFGDDPDEESAPYIRQLIAKIAQVVAEGNLS